VPVSTGELNIALVDLGNSNSWLFQGGTDRKYLDIMYDYMLGASDDVELDTESGLINEWTISDDSMGYSFKTRDGVTFWNGEEANASDITRFLLTVRKGEGIQLSSVGNLNNDVAEVDGVPQILLIDNNTFEVNINAPSIFWHLQWLSLLGQGGSPNHVVSMDHLEKIGIDQYNRAPLGTGPYRMDSIVPGDFLTVEAREDGHWFFGVPKTKTVTMRAIPEEVTRIALIRTGEADLGPIARASLASAKNAGLQIFDRPGSVKANIRFEASYVEFYEGYGPNPLNDARVRRALGLFGIDRQVIADTFMQGMAVPSLDYPSQEMDQTYQRMPVEDLAPFDQDRARALLAEAGYADGFKLDLVIWTPPRANLPEGPEIMEAIAVWWEELGIEINRVPLSYASFRKNLFAEGHGANDDLKSGGAWDRPTVAGMWGLSASPVAGSSVAGSFNPKGRYNTSFDPEGKALAEAWQSSLNIEDYSAGRQAFMDWNIQAGFGTGGGTTAVSYGLIWAGADTIPASWDTGPSRYAFNYKKIAAGFFG
jgi:peptide/nickel transport system substrate-binding protein